MLARSRHIALADRLLIEAVFAHGRPAVEIATLTGASTRRLRARVRQISRRLLSPAFVCVLRHRSEWTPLRCAVGTECIIKGRSLRAVAAETGLTYYMVRKHRDTIVALAATMQSSQPKAGAA